MSKRWMRVIGSLGLSFLVFASGARAQKGPGEGMGYAHEPHIFVPKGSAKTTNTNLIFHGGPTLPSSNVYAIYWGNFGGSDIPTALADFFGHYGGSAYANILTQYMGGRGIPSSSYDQDITDSSAPPARAPSTSTIVNEACKYISGTPDPDGVYVVVTSNFPIVARYCAWHSYGTCNGASIPVVYLPNPTGVSGCSITPLPSAQNPYSGGAQSMANLAAHELSEVVTDQFESAWYDSSGQEVGDKCVWQFGAPVTLGSWAWQIQKEWSNSNNGCVQSIP